MLYLPYSNHKSSLEAYSQRIQLPYLIVNQLQAGETSHNIISNHLNQLSSSYNMIKQIKTIHS